MPTGILSVNDGGKTTVSQLVGAPMAIPARVLQLLDNAFISESLLRDAGSNKNGLVKYDEETPLYLDGDLQEVAEFGEIPVVSGQRGLPRIAVANKRAFGIRVSQEMRDENNIDAVNTQIIQAANTAIRAQERALRAAFSNPAIPTIAATAAWTGSTAKIRKDLANAQEIIASATPTASQGDDLLGFEADTVVFPGSIKPLLIDNEEFLKVYKDSLSTEDIRYTGKMPKDALGMTALATRTWPKDRVLVLMRKVVGFYSDTRKLSATGLYPEGNGPMGGPTESWRSDTTYKRVIGIDQPKAAVWITGVQPA
ncbi:phage major capsid protein [Rhodococcoides corynebacterioides]|uniref:phage major capsid protein n=1 Tax=Rhodococcoides corynebacterioides TaxID=53972 RepID=UPI003F7F4996